MAALGLGAALIASGVVGCSKPTSPPVVIKPALSASVPTPTPTPRPTATPRPKPDLQKIPTWAQGQTLNSVKVRPGQKVFALTFDDGPWPYYTRQVLDVLKRFNVKATFFMVGQELERRPELAREVKAAGHAIGNHSWNHPSRPRDAVAQVKRTDALLRSLGITPTIFRPPYGLLKNGLCKQAALEKQAVLLWSADSGDWQKSSAATIARRIINQAHPGGIGLMHDGGGHRSHSVAALPIIIGSLQARGYRFVTIPELLKMRYVAPKKVKAKKSNLKTAQKKTSTRKLPPTQTSLKAVPSTRNGR